MVLKKPDIKKSFVGSLKILKCCFKKNSNSVTNNRDTPVSNRNGEVLGTEETSTNNNEMRNTEWEEPDVYALDSPQ